MNKFLILLLCLGAFQGPFTFQNSTNNEGTITYTEVVKLKVDLPEGMEFLAGRIPSEKVNTMELVFDENKSLYRRVKGVAKEKTNPFNGGNSNVTTMSIGGGENSSTFINFEEAKIVRSENVMGQRFLVNQDMTEATNWKVLDTQKEILGYTCIKAELTKGDDIITAWFSPELPLPIGPQQYHNLPGAVLQIESGPENARRTITATHIEWAEVSNQIVAPNKGKKVNADEFEKIVEKRLDAFRDGSSDGNVQIQVIGR